MTLLKVKHLQGWDPQEKAQCEQIPHESDKEWNNQLLSAVALQKWRCSSEMRFRKGSLTYGGCASHGQLLLTKEAHAAALIPC